MMACCASKPKGGGKNKHLGKLPSEPAVLLELVEEPTPAPAPVEGENTRGAPDRPYEIFVKVTTDEDEKTIVLKWDRAEGAEPPNALVLEEQIRSQCELKCKIDLRDPPRDFELLDFTVVKGGKVVPLAMVPGLVNGTTLKMRVLDTGEQGSTPTRSQMTPRGRRRFLSLGVKKVGFRKRDIVVEFPGRAEETVEWWEDPDKPLDMDQIKEVLAEKGKLGDIPFDLVDEDGDILIGPNSWPNDGNTFVKVNVSKHLSLTYSRGDEEDAWWQEILPSDGVHYWQKMSMMGGSPNAVEGEIVFDHPDDGDLEVVTAADAAKAVAADLANRVSDGSAPEPEETLQHATAKMQLAMANGELH